MPPGKVASLFFDIIQLLKYLIETVLEKSPFIGRGKNLSPRFYEEKKQGGYPYIQVNTFFITLFMVIEPSKNR
jgi:hypothetical protein